MRSAFDHLRSRDIVDDGVEQRGDIGRALFPDVRHPALFCAAVDRYEVELFFGGSKGEHQVENLFVHLFGAAVGLVHLVDYDDRLFPQRERFLQYESGLRHRALERVDQQQYAVAHIEYPLHLASEVGVARGVDDVDFVVAVNDRDVFRQDRDSSFAFQIVVVHDQFA